MAVSSSSSSTSKTGTSLDVAGIVSGLMEAENIPISKIDAKIGKATVKVTALGQLKSLMSTLQTALTDMQTPTNFYNWVAKSTNETAVSAVASSAASAGNYQLEVSQLARASIWNISGFTSEANALAWYNHADQANVRTSANATVLSAANGQYVLSLRAKNTGTASAFSLNDKVFASPLTSTEYQTARNAIFKVNDVELSRSTNAPTDVLTGITLNLSGVTTSSVALTINQSSVSARPKLDSLVKAYNDLYTYYKQQTLASQNTATRGALNSDFSVNSMMEQVLSGFIRPLANGSGVALTGQTDLASLGLKLSSDGKLSVDDSLLSKATTLQSRLADGIRIGYDTASSNDLSTRITGMLASGGVLQDRIQSEQKVQTELNSKKTALQSKLATIQARYFAQYGALDALIYKLQGTSDSLKSALDSLTNSQRNN